ncbi:hypothetical protein RRG08_062671 [Elysia crispata]|uniref:Uncharacterized protein n=1 Tax=Elysia crispata TaxID=231223 RepID=A0AAE0XMD4_9GAST|nr:hypothetical protein RRG08_062671 [Elysia crispata]
MHGKDMRQELYHPTLSRQGRTYKLRFRYFVALEISNTPGLILSFSFQCPGGADIIQAKRKDHTPKHEIWRSAHVSTMVVGLCVCGYVMYDESFTDRNLLHDVRSAVSPDPGYMAGSVSGDGLNLVLIDASMDMRTKSMRCQSSTFLLFARVDNLFIET